MIGSINSMGFGTNWYNMAAMNDFRLAQAFASKGTNAVSPVKKPSSALNSDAAKFLKEYQSHLSDLEKLAKDLSNNVRTSATNALGVTSSNGSVLDVSAQSTLNRPASYTVEVRQLARSQVNVAQGVNANDAPTALGSFVLETKVGTFGFDIDASQAGSNREMFSALADEINRLNTGVTAQVVEDSGVVSIAITGDDTGAGSGFTISGSFAEQTGLDAIAQRAQDAVYTVDKAGDSLGAMEFTSSSNTVSIGGYQIEATLKNTGVSQVEVGADYEGMADKIGELVNQYNKTISFLDANSDRGVGVLQQLRRLIQPPTGTKSMKMAGISVNADGSYAFDRNTFIKAMDRNPTLIRDIIGGDHGVAQGLQRDARDGLNTPSAKLLGSTGSTGSQQGSFWQQSSGVYDKTTLSLLSAYSKSGAYNMMNYYAVGAMMNLYI